MEYYLYVSGTADGRLARFLMDGSSRKSPCCNAQGLSARRTGSLGCRGGFNPQLDAGRPVEEPVVGEELLAVSDVDGAGGVDRRHGGLRQPWMMQRLEMVPTSPAISMARERSSGVSDGTSTVASRIR